MTKPSKKSLAATLGTLKYLPNRTPDMAFSGGAEDAFAEVSKYRDGSIYVGHYSGDSEWERHSSGDEIVLALEGRTTVVLHLDAEEERIELESNELVVVPRNTWHRFEGSCDLKIVTVTPQPTDHSLETPGTERDPSSASQ